MTTQFLQFSDTVIIPVEKITGVEYSPAGEEEIPKIVSQDKPLSKKRPAGLRIHTNDPHKPYYHFLGEDAEWGWNALKDMSITTREYARAS